MTTVHRIVTHPQSFRRIGRPVDALQIPFVEPEAPEVEAPEVEAPEVETAPATSCSGCENFGPALAQIEDVLNSILLDVEHLRTRVEEALGAYPLPPADDED